MSHGDLIRTTWILRASDTRWQAVMLQNYRLFFLCTKYICPQKQANSNIFCTQFFHKNVMRSRKLDSFMTENIQSFVLIWPFRNETVEQFLRQKWREGDFFRSTLEKNYFRNSIAPPVSTNHKDLFYNAGKQWARIEGFLLTYESWKFRL